MKSKRMTGLQRVRAAIVEWWTGNYVEVSGTGECVSVSSTSGVVVNDQSMLCLSAGWACVRLISETMASLPLAMYEKTKTGKRLAPDHPLHFILHDQPNADSTACVYWEAVVSAMLVRGTARSEKLITENGKLTGVRFLYPNRLNITKDSAGNAVYKYTGSNGKVRTIPQSRIWEIPGYSLDGETGVSVIKYGANVFGSAQAADLAAAKTFENGLMQTVYYKMEKILSPAQRIEFRENIKAITGALNAGKSPILEGGMEADTIGINPKDAQLLESRGFSVEEICRWFRVPPFMVGHSEKSTSWGSGIEQQMIGFLTFTLSPWLKRIEQAISKDLIPPKERARFYPKFKVEGLLRADSAGRATFYGAMADRGVITRDEIREWEDLEPMGGNAAVLTVQSAMTTLDSIGQNTDANETRAALRSFLGFDDQPKEPKEGPVP